MTLNLSGGREQGLTWGLSSADPNPFLDDLANDRTMASFLKSSYKKTMSGDFNSSSKAVYKVVGSRDSETVSSTVDVQRQQRGVDQNGRRANIVDATKSLADSTSDGADCQVKFHRGDERTKARSNGWTTSRRPQTLLQNGQLHQHSSSPVAAATVLRSPKSPQLVSPHTPLPGPVYHSPSPQSTPPPPTQQHQTHGSPHYHNSSASSASSPATPTDAYLSASSSSSVTSCSRTQPIAPSPFTASCLPSSLPVNLLNQISNYDLVDTMVTLKSTSRDVGLHGQVGVVKHVMTGEMATVHILSTDSDVRVPCSSLEVLKPRLKDVVKVVGGTHCLGRIGMLMSITGDYGIIKFMRGDNISQTPLKNLGRYSPLKAAGIKTVDYFNNLAKSPSTTTNAQQLSLSSASPSSTKKLSPDNPFMSANSTTTTTFPLVALHYPSFPLLIPGTTSQGGCFVSLPGATAVPSPTSNEAVKSKSTYAASVFPRMMSPFSTFSSETPNGMGTLTRDFSSSSPSSRSHSRIFPQSSFPFTYPPSLSVSHPLKSDDLSPSITSKDGPSPFSFVRQDSAERDSAQRGIPSKTFLRPAQFHPAQSPSLSLERPSVIQSSSVNSPGADRHRKGLIQPIHAIERAKAFMATANAMGACPLSGESGSVARGGRIGGAAVASQSGSGSGSHGASNSRVPPPYSTFKLGPHPHSHSSDHQQQQQKKVNPEERIRQFLERIVHNRRSYAYRRNSGEGSHDVKTSCIRISLICPLSQKRMSYPCRGHACRHHQCFDADAYVRYNLAQKVKKRVMKQPNGKGCVQSIINKKWQCPICHSTVMANQLYIDKDIFAAVKESAAQEVELGDDGSWRPVQKEENKIEVIDLTDLDD